MEQDVRPVDIFCDMCGNTFDIEGKMHIVQLSIIYIGIYRRNVCESCKKVITHFIDTYKLTKDQKETEEMQFTL